jgi:hypothetical protein
MVIFPDSNDLSSIPVWFWEVSKKSKRSILTSCANRYVIVTSIEAILIPDSIYGSKLYFTFNQIPGFYKILVHHIEILKLN